MFAMYCEPPPGSLRSRFSGALSAHSRTFASLKTDTWGGRVKKRRKKKKKKRKTRGKTRKRTIPASKPTGPVVDDR